MSLHFCQGSAKIINLRITPQNICVLAQTSLIVIQSTPHPRARKGQLTALLKGVLSGFAGCFGCSESLKWARRDPQFVISSLCVFPGADPLSFRSDRASFTSIHSFLKAWNDRSESVSPFLCHWHIQNFLKQKSDTKWLHFQLRRPLA